MTTPRPDLLPPDAKLVTWTLTPEAYADDKDWRRWEPGPWENEPDRIEWRAPGSALPRLALRNRFGAWCGYVGVPEGHPLFGKGWDAPEVEALRVHGGVTYAAPCAHNICHVPLEGESDHVWWIGFDTSHAWDYTPGLAVSTAKFDHSHETYRDSAFIIGETELLAAQLGEPPA